MDIRELIKDVKNDIQRLRGKIEELEVRKNKCYISGINYEGEKVSGSTNTSRVEKTYLEYIDFKDKLESFKEQVKNKRDELIYWIDQLDDPKSIQVMYKYCLSEMSIKEVADEIGYSKPNVHKIYKKSIIRMQERVDEMRQNETQVDE